MKKLLVAAVVVAGSVASFAGVAAAQGAVLVGDTTLESHVDSDASGQAEAFPFTASVSGTTTDAKVYVDTSDDSTKIIVGVYSNGSTGKAQTLLATGSTTSFTKGAWNDVTLGSASLTSGTQYWLAVLGTGGHLGYRDQGTGTLSYTSTQTSLTAMPSTFSSGSSWSSGYTSVYVNGTPAVPSNTSAPTITGTPTEGDTLTASSGSWSGASPISYSYLWSDGTTGSTDVLGASDVGAHISVTVTATNAYGSTNASSSSVGPVDAGDTCLQLQPSSGLPYNNVLDSCGYPSADAAGVPSGTSLTTVSSTCGCLPANTVWTGDELAITGPTTIDDLNIPGNVYFVASDFANPADAEVTIENSQIQASNPRVVDPQGLGGVTVEHSAISGVYSGSTCASPAGIDVGDNGAGLVLDHDYMSCAGEPVNSSASFTLTNSFILVDGYQAGAHVEDAYVAAGTGGDIENNTLLNSQTQTAGIFGDSKIAPLSGLTVKGNLIATNGSNGDIAVGCIDAGTPNDGNGYDSDVDIENNRLSSAYNTSAYPFAPGNTDGGSGTTWSGNYADGTLTSITQPVGGC